ncbi:MULTISPECIES: NmrA family NAD(P)-binding protein [Amycolatopsis]|uniref:NmrA family NAD(P)-binding protein n=1 Tax=Amycolatopsis dongchuanensis TaxID=1070866 RepID=A0ABP8VS07_9PSEU
MTTEPNTPAGPVLVTGATGRHGGTGAHVVHRLLEAGRPVRVLTRRPGAQARELRALGAEVVIGDLHDRRSLIPALRGVPLVYFAYPIDSGIVPAAANLASAARETDAPPRVVVMSMGPATPEHPSALGRAQWLAEEVLAWAGLDLTVLRIAAQFHENLKLLFTRSVRDESRIRNSFGRASVSWISGRDAAELASAALLHPERFAGRTVHHLAGTEMFSYPEVAGKLTELLGRTIDHRPVSVAEWHDELVALSAGGDDTVNVAMAGHISAVGGEIAERGMRLAADPARFEQLTGRRPTPLDDFLAAASAAWRP